MQPPLDVTTAPALPFLEGPELNIGQQPTWLSNGLKQKGPRLATRAS